MNQKKQIINAVKTEYLKHTQKIGIDLSRTIEEALKIDKETGTTYWADAMAKKIKNTKSPKKNFQGEKVSPDYKYIRCHMNFEIEMDFIRKAQFVAGGHMTDPPPFLAYSSIMSIRIK